MSLLHVKKNFAVSEDVINMPYAKCAKVVRVQIYKMCLVRNVPFACILFLQTFLGRNVSLACIKIWKLWLLRNVPFACKTFSTSATYVQNVSCAKCALCDMCLLKMCLLRNVPFARVKTLSPTAKNVRNVSFENMPYVKCAFCEMCLL